jgi:adrenodoxin-NADP+ reductase
MSLLKSFSALTVSKTTKNFLHSTSSQLKSPKVCIVGSGPAALYTAQYILKQFSLTNASHQNIHPIIDIYEKLPVPFGLVRYGVAPDHQDVKNVINSFTDTMMKPMVNFYGNVSIGSDIKISELMSAYTAVVLAYGSHSENYLNIKVVII